MEATIANTPPQIDTHQSHDEGKRERSTIEFPYTDLEDAENIVTAVHALGGGSSCEWNTLAGKVGAAPEGGAFRSRMTAARMFGLLRYEKDQVTLTDLGLRICDPQQQKAARVGAFLSVPLYAKVYELFNGKTLPPVTGLEATIGTLGVVPKQRERARQALQRSAKQAGFFDFGHERLVKPAVSQTLPKTLKPEVKTNGDERPELKTNSEYDPLIEGLLQRLPKPEAEWSTDARRKWLQAAANIFDMMYTDQSGEAEIVIECKYEPKRDRK